MGIHFNKQTRTFALETNHTSYRFRINEIEGLEHLYYGKKLPLSDDLTPTANRQIYSWASVYQEDRRFANSTMLQEYSSPRDGDFRDPSFNIDAKLDTHFTYAGHAIHRGKKELERLPSAQSGDEVMSLEVKLQNADKTLGLILSYAVYPSVDVIVRSSRIENRSKEPVFITKADSICLDFPSRRFDYLTLSGMYGDERGDLVSYPVHKGHQGTSTHVGISSHFANPFFALLSPKAKENKGDVYGFNLIYSGDFANDVEVDRIENTRVSLGINPIDLRFEVKPGESFVTPEGVMTYSRHGLGGMSRNFHDFTLRYILDPKIAKQGHPIVFNSWEAKYFDVDEKVCIELIEQAKSIDADTFVLDDGWFRKHDKGGLGNWVVDKDKFPNGLTPLREALHKNGLKFGLWVEPEMISLDSPLLKKFPNIILSNNLIPLQGRHQYIIDLTVKEHVDAIADMLIPTLLEAKPDYIKWDFNRNGEDMSSKTTPLGEVAYRQTLGTYELLRRVKKALPGTYIEGCAGGGGRFDLGILRYCNAIWASDNTDPYSRILIQYGTSIAYPPSVISCHVSRGEGVSGKPSTLRFRHQVASFGCYGYELDLAKNSEEDVKTLKELTAEYRLKEPLVENGDLYRLISPFGDIYVSYLQVSKDRNEALFTFLQMNASGLYENVLVPLAGLDPKKNYKNLSTGDVLSGKALMTIGLRVANLYRMGKSGSGIQVRFVAEE